MTKQSPTIAELSDPVAHQQVHDAEDGDDDEVDQRRQRKQVRAEAETQPTPRDQWQGRDGAEVVERYLEIVEGQDEADEEGPEQAGPDSRQRYLQEAAQAPGGGGALGVPSVGGSGGHGIPLASHLIHAAANAGQDD